MTGLSERKQHLLRAQKNAEELFLAIETNNKERTFGGFFEQLLTV